jgi:hypothetical protein
MVPPTLLSNFKLKLFFSTFVVANLELDNAQGVEGAIMIIGVKSNYNHY